MVILDIGVKPKKRNGNNLVDALRACGDEEVTFNGDKLSLLSVHLRSALLPSSVQFEPWVNLEGHKNNVLNMQIKMKLGYGQERVAEVFSEALNGIGLGVMIEQEKQAKYEAKNRLERSILRNTKFSDLEEKILDLTFPTDNVERYDFTMLGQQYYMFTVAHEQLLPSSEGEVTIDNTMFFLFKERAYDGESLLSGFVDKEIPKDVRGRLVYLVGDLNLSSHSIGAITNQGTENTWTYYSVNMTSDTELLPMENNWYLVMCTDSRHYINMNRVKDIKVEAEQGKFKVSFITKENKLTLLYG